MRKAWLELGAVVACGVLALGMVIVLARATPDAERLPFDSTYVKRLRDAPPDVVLIGNSMVNTRFDLKLVNDLVRPTQVAMIAVGGSRGPVWYAQLKHSIVASGARPRRVIVFFRGGELTKRIRTDGPDGERLERATRGRDAVIERKVAVRRKSRPEKLRDALARIAPVEKLRAHSWAYIDVFALRLSERFATGPPAERRKRSINRLFGVEQLRPDNVESDVEVDEKPSNFSRSVARSFLPDILELARENGIALTFVKVRTRRDASGISEGPRRTRYYEVLRAYLEGKGASYLDLSTNAWETPELYGSGDHIASRHRPAYTRRFVREHPDLFRVTTPRSPQRGTP